MVPIGNHCVRRVRTADIDETVRSAAERMRAEEVGCLVIVDGVRPVKVLTDRDVALQICDSDLDPDRVTVRDVDAQPAVTIDACASVDAALRKLRRAGVRRLVVLDDGGGLAGLVVVDDLLRLLAAEVTELGQALRVQLTSEAKHATPRVA